MKTNIYFTRHAECQSNIDPFFTGDLNGLTEKGVNQANEQRLVESRLYK